MFAKLPVTLPSRPLPADVDLSALAGAVASRVKSLQPFDFSPDAVWRDSFALTGSYRTFYSPDQLWPVLCECAAQRAAGEWSDVKEVRSMGNWVEVVVSFTTQRPGCENSMILWVVVDESTDQADAGIEVAGQQWKIWCLMTVLEDLLPSTRPGPISPAISSFVADQADDMETTYAIIVGAGPSGLSLSARLAHHGVPHLLIDANPSIGSNWLNRYHAARLHTIREYSHLPYTRTFGPEYPEWLGREDLAKGYQDYVESQSLSKYIRLHTKLVSGSWDATSSTWSLVLQNTETHTSTPIRAHEVALCTGAGGQTPFTPSLPGRHLYQGPVLHSVAFTTASALPSAPKTAAIIGTANTAHDIAEDLLAASIHPTLIQRSPTHVLPVEWYSAGASKSYNAATPTALADRRSFAQPLAVYSHLVNRGTHAMIARHPQRFDALEARGFRVDRFQDMGYILYERAGGHYMDTGASARVARGEIRVADASGGVAFTAAGLVAESARGEQTEVPADVVIYATGFERDMHERVRGMLGEEVAGRCEEYGGVDAEGEVRGAWRPMGRGVGVGKGQKGLWMCGGTLGQARYGSGLVGLSIAAAYRGQPVPVWERDFGLGDA